MTLRDDALRLASKIIYNHVEDYTLYITELVCLAKQEAYEESAKVCQQRVNPKPFNQDWDSGYDNACVELAAAIRKMANG